MQPKSYNWPQNCIRPCSHEGPQPDAVPPAPDLARILAEVPREVFQVELLKRSFRDFLAAAWQLADGKPFRPNLATDALVAALQAVGDGQIKRLVVCIPPGVGKSTIISVFYTAWQIARDPSYQVICASNSSLLANRDSLRARRIVESPWFQSRFGARLQSDQNRMDYWQTTANGHRIAVGVDSSVTGLRANGGVIADDLLNAIDATSDSTRERIVQFFDSGLSTRVDGDAPIIVVGQRLHPADLPGRLIEQGGWVVLNLACEFDPRKRAITPVWVDPRQSDGELLAPEIISAEKVASLKAQIGSVAFETQYNQNPSNENNALFKRNWFRFYRPDHAPEGQKRPFGCFEGPAAVLPEKFDRVTIAADLTFGSTTGDFAVVQAWGKKGSGIYLLEQWRRRAGFEEQVAAILAMRQRFGARIPKVIVEKAANGAAVIETLQKRIQGVVAVKPLGSKLQRATAAVPIVESGCVYLPESAPFVSEFIDEIVGFGGAARHDDMVDTAVYAMLDLANGLSPEAQRSLLLGQL